MSRMSKYRNVKTVVDGITFDSKKEAQYYGIYKSLMKAKNPKDRVVGLELQVPFPLEVNGKKIGKYIADFRVTYGDGRIEVIDVKGVKTAVYRLKKKLVSALYGVDIVEV